MEREELMGLLEQVRRGDTPPEEAAKLLERSPAFEDLGYAGGTNHGGLGRGRRG